MVVICQSASRDRTVELISLDEKRQTLKAQAKAIDSEVDKIDASIRAAIGSAEVGKLANGVAFKLIQVSKKEHMVKACTYTQMRRSAPKD